MWSACSSRRASDKNQCATVDSGAPKSNWIVKIVYVNTFCEHIDLYVKAYATVAYIVIQFLCVFLFTFLARLLFMRLRFMGLTIFDTCFQVLAWMDFYCSDREWGMLLCQVEYVHSFDRENLFADSRESNWIYYSQHKFVASFLRSFCSHYDIVYGIVYLAIINTFSIGFLVAFIPICVFWLLRWFILCERAEQSWFFDFSSRSIWLVISIIAVDSIIGLFGCCSFFSRHILCSFLAFLLVEFGRILKWHL